MRLMSFSETTQQVIDQTKTVTRRRGWLHLKPGDVLEFDETAPFLKATKTIPPQAWEEFGKGWKDPWPDMTMDQVMDDLRGPVELPSDTAR
jgi:hypothetical protein